MSDLTNAMRRNYSDLNDHYGVIVRSLPAAARIIDAIEAIAQGCENYTKGDCFQAGRTIDARYGADRSCWPCTLRDILHREEQP